MVGQSSEEENVSVHTQGGQGDYHGHNHTPHQTRGVHWLIGTNLLPTLQFRTFYPTVQKGNVLRLGGFW